MNSVDDPPVRRRDIRVKREEYALSKEQTADKDVRMMRLTVFWLFVAFLVGSVIGTFAGWAGASHVLAILASTAVGTMIRVPIHGFFGSTPD